MDLFMPDMDGFTILENMRTSPSLKDIPVLVISGAELDANQQNQLTKFGQDLLRKGSLSEKELLDSLEKLLSRLPTASPAEQ